MDILFDIGRVLLDFDYDAPMRRLMQCGTPGSHARMMEALENRYDLESGKIDPDEFIQRVIAASGAAVTADDFRHSWRHIFTRNAPMWDIVKRLKSDGGHRLILFSNTNSIHCPWMFSEFQEFDLFDEKVLSYEVGAMKPDQAIYLHAIQKFGLTTSKTRYIDDLPENITTGIQIGFRCHLYDQRNHDALEAWLADELQSN